MGSSCHYLDQVDLKITAENQNIAEVVGAISSEGCLINYIISQIQYILQTKEHHTALIFPWTIISDTMNRAIIYAHGIDFSSIKVATERHSVMLYLYAEHKETCAVRSCMLE